MKPPILLSAATAAALVSLGSVAQAADPAPSEGQHFVFDPVADGVLIGASGGFAYLLGQVLSSGEIGAEPPNPVSNLNAIDRGTATATPDKNAATYSDIGLYTTVGFAILDPLLSGFRDGWDAALVDGVMYGESIAITETLTDLVKIAVRRPRPIDYLRCQGAESATPPPGCASTDLELSFFSGHASTVATISATATYLAFVRDPHTVRPWITLGVGTALTAFVSYERVRSGEHFPTDVIMGSLAGAAVGVIVPHWHRHASEAPPVVIGAAPAPGGGTMLLQGRF